jgi:hypothetical protein
MCKRTTTDPLVRQFLDRYKLNLLAVPRENARCGQIYLRSGTRVSSAVDVTELLDAPTSLPPQFDDERLGDLAGFLSDGVSLDVGLGLLQGFLTAIGAGAVVSEVSAGYRRADSASLRFRFTRPTRDSIEPGALGSALEGRRFRHTHPLVQPDNEYFITAAVARSRSISVVAEDRRSRTVELGAEVVAAVNAHAGVTLESAATGEVTFEGEVPLAFGLELYELRVDADGQKLSMLPQDSRDALKAGKPAPPPPPVFVAPDDEALLAVDDRDQKIGVSV